MLSVSIYSVFLRKTGRSVREVTYAYYYRYKVSY